MFDHWSDEVNLKKAYVGVTNVLESNPNAYIWAGRDFHQRPQQGINDYFWMNHDGQGAGVKNFDIGGVQFDVAAVSQVKSCSPEVMADETNPSRITCTGSSDTGDNGHYALTTKTHNIKAGRSTSRCTPTTALTQRRWTATRVSKPGRAGWC
ncbi:maltoporin [Klebsiella pneumoniae]|uniref:Maltoporin n=1 Tax=Klebsiella pneumoniae TaxID=573 RepID=A0A4P0YJ01_KLEPN|nr:maltoporin [Klebsiella pneumoniae]